MSNSRPLAYDRVNLFGPTPINMNVAGNAQIFALNDGETKFMPTSIVLENAYERGTQSTPAVVRIDNGITDQNVSDAVTYTIGTLDTEGKSNVAALVANPVPVITGKEVSIVSVARSANIATVIISSAITGAVAGDIVSIEGAGEFNADKVVLSNVSGTTLNYINVGVDVATTSATLAKVVYGNVLRLKKTTLGQGRATTLRARANGVATLTFAAAHGLNVGDTVSVVSVGGTGYNDANAEITAVTTSSPFTISYVNAGGTEASTADTAGRVGALYVNAYVVGIYY
jgi:hypothetical protein